MFNRFREINYFCALYETGTYGNDNDCQYHVCGSGVGRVQVLRTRCVTIIGLRPSGCYLSNTPLVALGICLYRHFAMSGRMESNLFSVVNFIETLVIIAFCSFAIGLYWRFKFRSKKLRATMKQMDETLYDYSMIVRCHRAFLVNLGQVEQIVSHSGSTKLLIKHCHYSLPVSRSNMAQVKAAIKQGKN